MTAIGIGISPAFGSAAGAGGAAVPLDEQILALPGVFAYHPLTETSGTTADNAEGTAALDGTYTGTPSLASVSFPVGDMLPFFDGVDSVTIPTAATHAAMNWSVGWWMLWCSPSEASLVDGAVHRLVGIRRNGEEELYFQKEALDYMATLRLESGNSKVSIPCTLARGTHTLLVAVWDQAGDGLKLFVDGVLVSTFAIPTAPLLNALVSESASLVGVAGANWLGAAGHSALGAGQALSEADINSVFEAVYPGVREITFAGDSKSNANDYWPAWALTALDTATSDKWRERPRRIADAGQRVAWLHSELDTVLPGIAGNPEAVLMNIGANDITGGTAEASFKSDLTGAIDAYLSRFPTTIVYVAKPYRDDAYDGSFDATALAMAGWIDDVIATYPSGVAAGPDENVWFKGANIDTYSTDRIHANTEAGATETVNQWMTALGY